MPFRINRIFTVAECAPWLCSEIMNENLVPSARLYAGNHQLDLADSLGSGKDGIVFMGKRKAQPARVAVKVFRRVEAYEREKAVYERLRSLGLSTVLGFAVPRLVGSDDDARVIEMTIVERPFVLDFAGAYIGSPPKFSEQIWKEWETEKREQFEHKWPEVQRLLDAFQELGIYLLDVTPGNIGFAEP